MPLLLLDIAATNKKMTSRSQRDNNPQSMNAKVRYFTGDLPSSYFLLSNVAITLHTQSTYNTMDLYSKLIWHKHASFKRLDKDQVTQTCNHCNWCKTYKKKFTTRMYEHLLTCAAVPFEDRVLLAKLSKTKVSYQIKLKLLEQDQKGHKYYFAEPFIQDLIKSYESATAHDGERSQPVKQKVENAKAGDCVDFALGQKRSSRSFWQEFRQKHKDIPEEDVQLVRTRVKSVRHLKRKKEDAAGKGK